MSTKNYPDMQTNKNETKQRAVNLHFMVRYAILSETDMRIMYGDIIIRRTIMKKIIAVIAAAALAALSGCASDDSSSAAESSRTAEESTSSVTETESASDSSAADAAKNDADDSPLLQQESTPMPALEKVSAQYEENKDGIAGQLESIAKEKEHPCINITTEDSGKIKSKDEYTAAVIDVFNCDEAYRLTAAAGVKVRGNSTADQGDEKPYRIKFEEKQGMLGLHGGKAYKSWVLLRSYWNLAPDYAGLSLAKTIFEGKYYSTDFMYVNLYINGEPAGLYLLCEQNQAADDRIDVHEPKPDETGTDIGYAIEMDNYASDEHPYFTLDHTGNEFEDISGVTRKLWDKDYSIKSDINTKGQLEFISKYTEGCFRILYEAAENGKAFRFDEDHNTVPAEDITPQQAAEAVIDTDSLINMLILQELVHNNDVGAGSFYMAIDFSEQSKYKKLTFLAPWDFNWAYEGKSSGKYYACTFQDIWKDGYDRSNIWYTVAMKADWFADKVKAKWKALHDSGALTETTKQILMDCYTLKNDLGEESWKTDKAKDICNFINGRIKWLDKQWL